MRYGFLGAGNMASAIIHGMVKSGFPGKDIYVFNPTITKSQMLADQCGVVVCHGQKELIEKSEVLILAVKPQVLETLTESIKNDIADREVLVISLAVGKTIDYLERSLGAHHAIARVMPSINARVLASASCFCCNTQVTTAQKEEIIKAFSTIGSLTEIGENLFSIHGAIAGSSPAFAYIYMDALAKAAQKAGMPKNQALKLAAQTVEGSAKMLLESGMHPYELADLVCSPGGTTIEGVCVLENLCFTGTVVKAVDAVLEKDKTIQRKTE